MKDNVQNNQSGNETFLTQLTSEIKMAAASIPSTSGIQQTPSNNKEEEKVRPSTIEEESTNKKSFDYKMVKQPALDHLTWNDKAVYTHGVERGIRTSTTKKHAHNDMKKF
ncbi:hypothetical protein AVEN_178391-1 [Araneus ventricosus]|uniref:Uncharacterized protein n=1 Tax=Araneus ventricosus TaxID=182803 RepID=A0A4Y2BF26_ARAVE|nr:hypothetical protein AVEN_178391-1 [Araneus ventricosus]